ncbi:hypothetical protein LSAT2_002744 [Lamellibrachia satsuma]|nr:hypothetical protein LSAT2_002744 [Lamellibrachia satsuma]
MKRLFSRKRCNGGSVSNDSVNFLPSKDRSNSQISDKTQRSSSSDYQECMTSECPEMSTVPDFQGGVSESNYTLAP